MRIKPGVLFNFPLARYTPQVWRFRVTYDDPARILMLDKGSLSGEILQAQNAQVLPADLEKKPLREKLASCSCPVCDIESEYAKPVSKYLEFKPRPSEEDFSI
jgi:hypothetical protein